MTFIEDFNLLLKARYSIIYISTNEEDRLEYTIRNCIKLGKNRAVYTWDFIDGFLNNPNKKEIVPFVSSKKRQENLIGHKK